MFDYEMPDTLSTRESDAFGTVHAIRFWTADRVSGLLMAFMSLMQGTEMYNVFLRYALKTFLGDYAFTRTTRFSDYWAPRLARAA